MNQTKWARSLFKRRRSSQRVSCGPAGLAGAAGLDEVQDLGAGAPLGLGEEGVGRREEAKERGDKGEEAGGPEGRLQRGEAQAHQKVGEPVWFDEGRRIRGYEARKRRSVDSKHRR
jgi:hypothetical protein